jgi:hypothetical protein
LAPLRQVLAVAGGLVVVAVAAVVAAPIIASSDREPVDVSPGPPATSVSPLPPQTLRCRIDGTDYYPEVGMVSPGAAGAVLCLSGENGHVDADRVEGDVSGLVDVVNTLPDDSSWCFGGGEYAYDLVLGYPDGHTEVVNGFAGGECDSLAVNGADRRGATKVLNAFRALAGDQPSGSTSPTPPDPGNCEAPTDGPIAQITINSGAPTPLCLIVDPTQRIRMLNATDQLGQVGERATVGFGSSWHILDAGESVTLRQSVGELAEGVNLLDIQLYDTFWVVEIWVR